ncbi:MAG: hypothetical protein A2W25_02390 [candidate division Zixibacteria bacterium RBG_16_53_22]|nr:MAG: hypothetical protein A2W25_02390 [candidate division Zixibacteria bacterium RBG_16_53_22]
MLKRIDDYPTYLEAAWQEHLKPKDANAPTVISLFAGCGGSSLGYSMAGFRELLAVEYDNNAVETFKLNFPDVPIYPGDIAKLSVDECLRLANLKPGELDILDGSPPCQGFSTAGKRQIDDPRNSLFKEYVRLLRGLRPKVFVMENVSGMVKGIMKLVFVEILRELKASGYQVSARLLNAMYFGVPQSRQRMIFIGVRDDLGIAPSHPAAETQPVTVRQALLHIVSTLHWGQFKNKGASRKRRDANKPINTIPSTAGGQQHFQVEAKLTGRIGARFEKINVSLDKPLPTVRSGDSAAYELETQPQDNKLTRLYDSIPIGGSAENVTSKGRNFNNMKKPDPDAPMFSIPKTVTNRGAFSIVHPTEKRLISIDELKPLASYPKGFVLVGKFDEKWARIGNCVPPLFARSWAKHICTEMLERLAPS